MTAKERILKILASDAVLDDDQIADRLELNRHYVNTICRELAREGLVFRSAGVEGKLVNARTGNRQWPPNDSVEVSAERRRLLSRVDRARTNVEELVDGFNECVFTFEEHAAFPGPSIYFHERALELRRRHQSSVSLMADVHFFEYIYAVLPAWGMHRMGKSAAKVGGFEEMIESFRSMALPIQELWELSITEVKPENSAEVASELWPIIDALKVSTSRTRIVAGTKALHHVLPNLVSPIDRQYSFRFFTGQKGLLRGDQHAFLDWFPYYCEIGTRCKSEIAAVIKRKGFMASGPAKIIDNAIIGFMQLRDG